MTKTRTRTEVQTEFDIHKPVRQYVLRTLLFMGGYTVVNVAAIFGAFDDARGAGAVALGLVVSAPVIGHLWAVLTYMNQADEYVRNLMARRFVIASGIAMALASTWGFMEIYGGVHHIPASMIVPAFWGAFGLVSLFVRSTK